MICRPPTSFCLVEVENLGDSEMFKEESPFRNESFGIQLQAFYLAPNCMLLSQ